MEAELEIFYSFPPQKPSTLKCSSHQNLFIKDTIYMEMCRGRHGAKICLWVLIYWQLCYKRGDYNLKIFKSHFRGNFLGEFMKQLFLKKKRGCMYGQGTWSVHSHKSVRRRVSGGEETYSKADLGWRITGLPREACLRLRGWPSRSRPVFC